ncbi:MAG TPA: PIN domain-containing protein [Terriglobales bacterium]|nr:PIN domain-containing protein [Terriglobales bacterium]
MKTLFDTSVLLPVFLEDHEHHEASLKVFLKATRNEAGCAAHSLAELYATATRLPGKHRLSGDQVLLFLENVVERLTPIALTALEYVQAIQASATEGIVGGTIYDALLAHCALKAGATVIYTWNVRHFQQLGPEIARRLRVP